MKVIKYSNIGCREINQDYLASSSFDQDKSIYLVADGIGGYAAFLDIFSDIC